jgi:PAS domain S-box-containing protein
MASAALAETVLSGAGDAILVLDPEQRIRYWNPAARAMLGYTTAEADGLPYAALLLDGRMLEPDLAEGVKRRSTICDFRTLRRRKDGSAVEISLTRSFVRGIPGSPEGSAVEIVRDITDRRQIERELIHTEKMAAVGKIASKVVHEIRNPLASINLNVDILLDSLTGGHTPEEQEAREILQTIKRETRRLTQITEEYLQFSRMPQPTGRDEDLNGVLLDLADFLRPELRRSGIRLVMNLDDSRPQVACDGRLLRQVILNLVRNAMEVVPTHTGQVMVVTLSRPDGAEVQVEDNGPGIPEEIQERVFEPFFTTKQEGTGLGLAVVRQIVEEHGGSVRCHSILGKGTSFRICLPRGGASEAVRPGH